MRRIVATGVATRFATATALAFTLAGGCGDAEPPAQPIPSNHATPEPDAGFLPDTSGDPPPPPGAPNPCDGAADGTSCALAQATGVCVSGRCRIVACQYGFGDCDGVGWSGCETRVSTNTNCGACNAACGPGEQCQDGPRGFVCSPDIVCAPGRFDLDRDVANGCEWHTRWVGEGTLDPIGLEIHAATPAGDSAFVVAGTELDRSVVSTAGQGAATFDPAILATAARASVVLRTADGTLVVGWQAGVTLHTDAGIAWLDAPDATANPVQSLALGLTHTGEHTTRQQVVGLRDHEVFAAWFGTCTEPDDGAEPETAWCPDARLTFGPDAYHQAYFPDAPSAPPYEPITTLASGDTVVVVTRRGFHLLDAHSFEPGLRLELDELAPHHYLTAALATHPDASDNLRLFLVHSHKGLHVHDLTRTAPGPWTAQPASPEIGLDLTFAPDARIHATASSPDHLLVTDGRTLAILAITGLSARTRYLGTEGTFVPAPWPIVATAPAPAPHDGFRILYHSPGRYFIRALDRD